MTTPRPITDFGFDNNAQRWRDRRNGRFVSEDAVTAEMNHHQTATFNALEFHTNELYNGEITPRQWQMRIIDELKNAHLSQAMFGAGGVGNMNQSRYGQVGATLRQQYRYLDGFTRDILAGNQSRAQALARIRQYGRATQQSYWNTYIRRFEGANVLIWWVLGVADHCEVCPSLAAGSPYTREQLGGRVPSNADTPCRANCNCHLRIERV